MKKIFMMILTAAVVMALFAGYGIGSGDSASACNQEQGTGHTFENGLQNGKCTVCGEKLVYCDAQTNEAISKYKKAVQLVNDSDILDFPADSVRILERVEQDLTENNGYCKADGIFDSVQVLDYLDGMFKNFVAQCNPSSSLYSIGCEASDAIAEAMDCVTRLITDKDLLDLLNI